MSERPKELASKASVAQVTEGSNPSATAEEGPRRKTGPFVRPERALDALVELEEDQMTDHDSPPLATQDAKSPRAFAASDMPSKPIWT